MTGLFGSINIFIEDGLSLNYKDVVPLALNYFHSIMRFVSDAGQFSQSLLYCLPLGRCSNTKIMLEESSRELVKYLKDNSHLQLGIAIECQVG